MTNCPKCETRLRGDAVRCPVCGTPVALSGFRPDPDRKADPVLDPMLDLFERDEKVPICPECLSEFREDKKRCKTCRRPLDRVLRTEYHRRLDHRPIRDLGEAIAAGPPRVPKDLVRVHVAHGLEETEALLQELAFVGLEPWPGSDSLDPFDDPGAIGIYVREPDLEAARYLVDAWSPADSLDLPPDEVRRTPRTPVEEAQEWIGFGKYEEALRVLERTGERGAAATMRVDAALKAGKVLTAGRIACDEARAEGIDDLDRGRLLTQAGIITALAADGAPFGEGADAELARGFLEDARDLAPRHIQAGKALVEILEHLGDKEALIAELRRLDRVCPNLFGHQGPFREIHDHALHGVKHDRPF